MKLYGFALLPTEEIQMELIAFQRRHPTSIAGPRLGLSENLPHTSILQCPYLPNLDYSEFLEFAPDCVESEFTSFFLQPIGWLFAGIRKTDKLQQIQNELFDATKHLIDRTQIAPTSDLSGLPNLECENYLAYGYRYIGEAFLPHVTIGTTRSSTRQPREEAVSDFDRTFAGRKVVYDRAVFYEAGGYGALKRIASIRFL